MLHINMAEKTAIQSHHRIKFYKWHIKWDLWSRFRRTVRSCSKSVVSEVAVSLANFHMTQYFNVSVSNTTLVWYSKPYFGFKA